MSRTVALGHVVSMHNVHIYYIHLHVHACADALGECTGTEYFSCVIGMNLSMLQCIGMEYLSCVNEK